MRHRVSGRRLGRTTAHRKALWQNLSASLIQHGAVRTTEAKAKELRRFVERLITTAKKGTLHARRQVLAALGDRELFNDEGELEDRTLVQKLFEEIAPRYADRPGGYTRIIRLADRRIGDSGRQVLMQLVEEKPSAAEHSAKTVSRRRRRAAKRREAAAQAEDSAEPSEETEDQAPSADDSAAEPQAAEESDQADKP